MGSENKDLISEIPFFLSFHWFAGLARCSVLHQNFGGSIPLSP